MFFDFFGIELLFLTLILVFVSISPPCSWPQPHSAGWFRTPAHFSEQFAGNGEQVKFRNSYISTPDCLLVLQEKSPENAARINFQHNIHFVYYQGLWICNFFYAFKINLTSFAHVFFAQEDPKRPNLSLWRSRLQRHSAGHSTSSDSWLLGVKVDIWEHTWPSYKKSIWFVFVRAWVCV